MISMNKVSSRNLNTLIEGLQSFKDKGVIDPWILDDGTKIEPLDVLKELIFLREAIDYIAIVAMKKNPHLGRPRSSDKECIFCLAYLALNDGAYGEHFEYKEMAEEARKGFEKK